MAFDNPVSSKTKSDQFKFWSQIKEDKGSLEYEGMYTKITQNKRKAENKEEYDNIPTS